MPSLFSFGIVALGMGATLAGAMGATAAPAADQAEQLRIIGTMSEQLRARIEKLPMLIPAEQPLGKIEERLLTLNREPVVIEGQRFDGIVVVSPAAKSSFVWAFVNPSNLASWYILREKGEMKGFGNFLRRTRSQVPLAAAMKPESAPHVTFQQLESAAWSPNERYIIWFRFTDDRPAEFSICAGFVSKPSLNNNALPALLFPGKSDPKP